MRWIYAFGQACSVVLLVLTIILLVDISIEFVDERKRSRRKGR